MHANDANNKDLLHKELSYTIFGILYKAHNTLGRHAREKQYCDVIEVFLKEEKLPYEREKLLSITGMDKNKADFIIDNKIVVEIKAIIFMGKVEYYQLLRYLEASKLKLGILVNFCQKYLKPKRIVNAQLP
ncbi:MAG: GTP-binding signal recognition particle [Parcubacteria group bacterium Gr01-1014_33]|nr:MAG: GTP-binding signal recognition particle [Parcubacteria group bacterium Gr01-1014_33]